MARSSLSLVGLDSPIAEVSGDELLEELPHAYRPRRSGVGYWLKCVATAGVLVRRPEGRLAGRIVMLRWLAMLASQNHRKRRRTRCLILVRRLIDAASVSG